MVIPVALIQACVKKDRNAQNQLYQLLAPGMYVLCQRYAGNKPEAEEILQEGFLKMFLAIEQFNNEGSFEGWVRKIMVNCALQKFRSKSRLHSVASLEQSSSDPVVAEDVWSQLGAKELLNFVQQLPPRYRMVFNLYVFEGLKHKEIAEMLGISEGTCKSNLFDARTILQKLVKESLLVKLPNVNCL